MALSASGGQRQRVALGRAIVRDPKVFLLDEPLSNLDAALRVSTRGELIKQHRRLGTTMIYVTHDQVEAMTMGTRICIMNGGRIAQVGRPMDVCRYPADTFVARFLGNPGMNLMAGEMTSVEGGQRGVRIGNSILPVPHAATNRVPNSSAAVTVGIRPEDFYDAEHVTPDLMPHPVQATVTAVEPLGADTLVLIELDGVSGEIMARLGRDVMARPGDSIELLVDVRMIRIFEFETGKALIEDPQKTTETTNS
jgi:multiple sugar transport system ATP-binding protein